MALLTNINGKFSVDTDGAASFNRIGASTTTGFTFPSADGANGEVLKTNGLGTVSWLPDSNTGTVTGTGAANRVAYWTTASNISYNDDFKYTGANKIALGGDIQTTLADFSTIEIGNIGMIMSEKADSQYNSMFVSSNAYYASGWKRKTATVDGSTYISMYLGGIRFGTTPQGAADSAITWTNQLIIANNGDSTFAGSITGTTASFTRLDINASNTKLKGDLLGNADAAYDIGASGANRPRNLYLSNSINAGDITTTGVGSFGGNVSTTGITTSGVTNNFSTGVAWGTNLSLTNTNDDISPPILTFRKAPVSGYTSVADGDYVGFINFRMDNTNNDEFSWVEMAARARDVTDGSEDSSFRIGTWGAGTEHAYTIMARSGNVGIGNVLPHAPLSIYTPNNTLGSSIAIQNNISGTGIQQGFYLGISTGTIAYVWNYENDDLVFATNNIERMRINAGGTIKMTDENGGVPILQVRNFATTATGAFTDAYAMEFRGATTTGSTGGMMLLHINEANDARPTLNVSDSNGIFATFTNGKVGIGTATPSTKLDVNGEVVIAPNTDGKQTFKFTTNASNDGRLLIKSDTTVKVDIQANGDSYFNGGKVGIGTTATPGRMLEVNGGITSDGGIKLSCSANLSNYWSGIEFSSSVATSFIYMSSDDVDGTLKFFPDASLKASLSKAGTWTVAADVIAYGSPSDKRLKENIKPIDSALDKVMKLKGVTFDWIQKEDQILNIKEDIGFIAQDVQKVIPELVRENEDGMLSMRHQGIAPILLEAIKELKAEIEELKFNKCNCNK